VKKKWQQDCWSCWFKKQSEQDDGIRRTFERHKNIGVTFTSGDGSNMKARGSRGNFTQFNVC
jgi:hypothetical protein